MSVRDARVYTCKHALYTISYRVHVYKLHNRRIPNVGVGARVGAVECQLIADRHGHNMPFAMFCTLPATVTVATARINARARLVQSCLPGGTRI